MAFLMDPVKILVFVLILILLVVVAVVYRRFKRSGEGNELTNKLAPYIDADYYRKQDQLAAELGVLRAEDKNLLERLGDVINQFNFLDAYQKRLGQKLSRAGIRLRASEFFVILFVTTTIFVVVGVVVSKIANVTTFYVMIPFGLVGYFIPNIVVSVKKSARLKKFSEQLVDTLVLVSNSLKAGYSFLQAVEMVARETQNPTAEEFERVVRENALGKPLDQALDELAERMESKDLDLVVTVVLIQREVGGNLSEILDSIAVTIRERIKLIGQVKALTAQGKLGGIVIAALPFGLFFVMYLLKPDVMSYLFTERCGIFLIIGGLIMQSIGAFVIKNIVSLDV